jgi:PAS fold
MLGQPGSRIIPRERRGEEKQIIARIQQGESVQHYETVRHHKDGRLLDVSFTVSPIRDRSGRIIGLSKIARDITEQKKAEAATQQVIEQLREQAALLELALRETNPGCSRVPYGYIFATSMTIEANLLATPGRSLACL